MKKTIIIIIILIIVGGALYLLFVKPPEEMVNEETSQEIARNWVLQNSPTYLFDGSDLELKESRALDLANCVNCYEFEYLFTSSQAGYGNREGESLAQVITPHSIVITVENGQVARAITDEKFDEMTDQFLESVKTTTSLFYYNKAQDIDDEGNVICSPDAVLPVEREIPSSKGAHITDEITEAIKLLLKGELTEEEKAQGFETEFPHPGFVLESAELNQDVLTLTFPEIPGFTSGGSCRVGLLRAQIEKTVLQFEEIKQVLIMPEEIFQP